MFSLRLPSADRLQRLIDTQAALDFTYSAVGMTKQLPPAGYTVDHNYVQLGTGATVFEAACEALRQWQQFPHGWIKIYPAQPEIKPGAVAAVAARVGALWTINACRIVYVLEPTAAERRFGFAYGTLPEHVETGEERFLIEWRSDDSVWYDIRALARPRHWLLWLGYPLSRQMQKRFARDSLRAMTAATERILASSPGPTSA